MTNVRAHPRKVKQGAESGTPTFPAEVTVEKMVAGGMALARLEGLAVFVAGGAPGDRLLVDLLKRSPDYAVAGVSRVIQPSGVRRPPPCPYLPACGGCQWQHLEYAAQLAAKRTILADALERVGGFRDPPVQPVTASPSEFGYRHRVQIKVLTSRGGMRWGFFAATSHTLVDVRRCLIAHPAINLLMEDLQSFVRGTGADPSRLGCVEFNVDASGSRVQCILHPRRRRFAPEQGVARASFPGPGGEIRVETFYSPHVKRLPVRGGEFTFQAADVELSTGPGVFGQTNLALNPRLVETVIDFVDPGPTDTVVDIYSGVGNYSIPMARRAGAVVAVENNTRACRYGELNARSHGLPNVRFVHVTAQEALASLPRDIKAAVLNPPRVGAAPGVMEGIAGLGPRRAVYVSCNPATLARDLALLARRGYRLERCLPFDMFPQTHHLETVAVMLKES